MGVNRNTGKLKVYHREGRISVNTTDWSFTYSRFTVGSVVECTVVLIRVNKIEQSVCSSLIHMYNTLGPILGAKCCIDKGQQDRRIRLFFFNSYVQHFGPHIGCQMLYR